MLGGLLLTVVEPRWIILGCGIAGLAATAVVFAVVNTVAGRTDGTAGVGEALASDVSPVPAA